LRVGEWYGRYIFTRDPFRIKPPNKTGIELPPFMMEQNQKQPVRTIRSGGLQISIWRNLTAESGKIYYSVTPQKRYTKDDGQTWESTNSYSPREAVLLANLLTEAAFFIRTKTEIDKLDTKR